ncbi:MAG TPA: sensor domain-containing diguanylate cyclase [Mycobacteriales bacterium]|nr:sensor domain-containing diguanylate cyclase [Mycobacteriales bacterium]
MTETVHGAHRRLGLRRHLSLAVSGTLVLGLGGLGLVAGTAAGDHARDVHRQDRLDLQETLAGLTHQYVLLNAREVRDELTTMGPWSAAPGDPDTTARLERLVSSTRSLDAGATLTGPTGTPLAGWVPAGELPSADDPGWAPLRAAVLSRSGELPVSGVLTTASGPRVAVGLPVPLVDGSRGLLVGLWDPGASGLQQYVSELRYGRTGHGYVVDGAGTVVAGPERGVVGRRLPGEQLRAAVTGGGSGIADTADGGRSLVTSYAPAGTSGWTALTAQDRDEFEGVLVAASRRVQYAVVALLLIAGASLVVLHRKRESALEDLALRDELTGLYNRRGWFAVAEHELERAGRQGTSRVLLFVDLDGLKRVNDALGHREGDRAIADAAAVLRAASRSSDVVGRLGGDEFVLLLGDDGEGEIGRRRLLDALRCHNERSDAAFELRLSVGAEVWFPEQACTLDELVRRADDEMYAEKSARPARADGVLRSPRPGGDQPPQVPASRERVTR